MVWLKGKKTYIVSILMVLASFVQFISGDMDMVEFMTGEHVMTLLEAAGLSALRSGITSETQY